MKKVCSFFGHRKINITKELEENLTSLIEKLITKEGVSIFLFGSKSEFNTLCHKIVNNLKEKYPYIKRVAYTCEHESCILEKDREKMQKLYTGIVKSEDELLCVDEEYHHKNKTTSCKASYIARNYAMIDGSDYCIFYYDIYYEPEMRKWSKHGLYYQPKSGTRLAYDYANQKSKLIYNLCIV